MAGIEAPWVGKTPEEWHEMTTGEKEYSFTITMTGTISMFGADVNDAKERVKEMLNMDLLAYIDDVEIEQE